MVSSRVDLGIPLAGIRTLGTGGLLAPAKKPGQLCVPGRGRSPDAARRGGGLADPRSRQRRASSLPSTRTGPPAGAARLRPAADQARPGRRHRNLGPGLLRRRPAGPGSLCRRDRQGLCHPPAAAASGLLHLVHGEARRCVRREAPGRAFRVRGQEPQAVRLRFHPDRRRLAGGHRRQRPEEELHHPRPRRTVSLRHEGDGRANRAARADARASGSCPSPAITRIRTSRTTRTGSPRGRTASRSRRPGAAPAST